MEFGCRCCGSETCRIRLTRIWSRFSLPASRGQILVTIDTFGNSIRNRTTANRYHYFYVQGVWTHAQFLRLVKATFSALRKTSLVPQSLAHHSYSTPVRSSFHSSSIIYLFLALTIFPEANSKNSNTRLSKQPRDRDVNSLWVPALFAFT
jgi:hypothetical protein